MRTINKLLPNELLIAIFKQVFTEYLTREQINDIKMYQENCRYCKDGHDINYYIEVHNREHSIIKHKKQIRDKYLVMNNDFNNTRQMILTCKRWRNICYKYFKNLFNIKVTVKKDDLRIILDKVIKHVILDPDLIQVTEQMWGLETIRMESWKYNHARNIILIDRQFRNKYYESVVDQESKRIQWCILCHQPVRIVMDKRRLKDVMKGRTNRELKRHRHWVQKTTRQEGDNRPVLIDTIVKHGYIKDIRTRWWCHNNCEIHCLDSFNHCNQGKIYGTYKMDKDKYRQKRMLEYPKITEDIDWNNSIVK